MPRSTANPSNKDDSKGDSNRQLGPTRAQEDAKKEAQIVPLKNIIETYISALKGHETSEDWSKVKADLAKIDHNHGDLLRTEEAMRNLNIRATNMYIDELESQVNRAKKRGEDAEKIRAMEMNYEGMRKNRGKFVLPAKKRKGKLEEDKVY